MPELSSNVQKKIFNFPAALVASCALLVALNCAKQNAERSTSASTNQVGFDAKEYAGYWNAGKAEISRYELSQARYGELHPGHAIMVYVSEEFLKDKQVKLESNNRKNAVPIIKLNQLRKFATGVYDYSMMGSVFTPTEFSKYPRTLKVTTTSQEWCGHTFNQFNLRGNQYRLRQYSYFESESDQDIKIPAVTLEDELWTKLRLSPDLLPVGELQMFPGSFYVRLRHRPLQAESATASKSDYTGGEFAGANLKAYRVEYPAIKRSLEIVYESTFPYQIAGWKETSPSGFGAGAKQLTTVARRTHTIRGPYWNQHDLKDRKLRAQLGLD